MKKTLPLVAGLAGAMLVSGMAQGAFVGIKITARDAVFDPNNPDQRLLVCNVYLVFSEADDVVLAVAGLIPPQPQLFYRTNSSRGFHQVPFGPDEQNYAVTAFSLSLVPALANDTYFGLALKSGEGPTAGGVLAGTVDSGGPPPDQSGDIANQTSPLTGIDFNWNAGGNILESNPVNGGGFITLDTSEPPVPVSDQNRAGAFGPGNQIFLGQLVIDRNNKEPTKDGGVLGVFVQFANVLWAEDSLEGTPTVLTGFDPDTGLGQALTAQHLIPAPGTLALLGLAGLAGIGRRRRRG